MTEKSKDEIMEFLKTYKDITDQNKDEICEIFLKLAKTVRARENGSKITPRKLEALKKNRVNSGRKIAYLDYTLIGSDDSIHHVKVEKTDRHVSLLTQIIKIEENYNIKIIERFEC